MLFQDFYNNFSCNLLLFAILHLLLIKFEKFAVISRYTILCVSENILFSAIQAYSGLISKPIYRRLRRAATSAVVPAPMKGSRIISLSRLPACMHNSGNKGGNEAEWFPLNDAVGIRHTDLRFAGPSEVFKFLIADLSK